MGYILYGSKTSPFVRRIRILLENNPYEFKEMNIFETQDAVELNKINPINQIPVLVDGKNTIWDSRVIFSYLNSIHRYQNVDWQDENYLTAIDGAMNAGVSLLLMKRSGINVDEQIMYVSRQKERMESILDYLTPFIKEHALNNWDFHTISLYAYLDWAVFRGLLNIDKRPECLELLNKYKDKDIVKATAIPKV